MSYWDKHPKNFKALFSLAVIIVLAAVSWKFYTTVTTVIDGSFASYISAKVYVTSTIPVTKEEDETRGSVPDSLSPGDIIISIEGKSFQNADSLRAFLDTTENIYLDITAWKIPENKKDITKIERENFSVQKSLLDSSSFFLLQKGAVIFRVLEGTAADRAGLKVGDIIIKVDSFEVSRNNNVLKYIRDKKPGQVLDYQILRNNEILEIKTKLASYGISFQVLLVSMLGLLFIGFSIFFGFKRPEITSARIIAYLFLLNGFFLGSGMNIDPPQLNFLSVVQYLMHLLAFNLLIPVLIHHFFHFPVEVKTGKRKLLYLIPYIVSVIHFSGLLFFYLRGMYTTYNISLMIYILLGFLYLPAIYFLNRKNSSKSYGKMARPVFFSWWLNLFLLSFTLLYFFFGLSKYLPDITYFFEYSLLIMAVIPLSYLYVIGKYRLLDLKIRIRRNIQYVLAISAWRLAAAVIFIALIWLLASADFTFPNIHFTGTSIEILDKPLNNSADQYYEKLFAVLIALVFGLFLWRISKNVQKFIDKNYYRQKFDYRKASAEIGDMLENNISVHALAEGLVKKLGSLINLKRAGMLLFNDDQKVTEQQYYGLQDGQLRQFCSYAGSSIFSSIDKFKGGFPVDYLSGNIKDIFRECDFRIIIPVKSKGKLLGALLLGEKLSEASFDDEDIEFMTSIAGQTAVAIENAMLYDDLARQERLQHEMKLARQIQLDSLPADVPEIEGLDISGISYPALEVGGDFYDFLNGKTGTITVIVGDVSGKGTSAALYMSKTQGIMRALADFSPGPKDLFSKTNRLLYKYIDRNSFITAIGACFDTNGRELHLSRAGHLPLYYFNNAENDIQRLVPKGVMIGMTKDKTFSVNLEQVTFSYNPGDLFVFVTDGITEARDIDNEEFGEGRLLSVLKQHTGSDSNTIRDAIVRSVNDFADGNEQFDDLTVVVVKAL